MTGVELGIVVLVLSGVASTTWLLGRRTRRAREKEEDETREPAVPLASSKSDQPVQTEETPSKPTPVEHETEDEELGATRMGAKFDLHAAEMRRAAKAANEKKD
jgi:hypothetical protein